MLIRRLVALPVLSVAAVVALTTSPGYADPIGECPPEQPDCSVSGTMPGGPGNGGGGGGGEGGDGRCEYFEDPVPCYIDGIGSYHGDGCYIKLATPQPPDDGRGGAFYTRTCLHTTRAITTTIWLATPPPGLGPTPQELAQQALAKVRLLGADIGLAPAPDGAGLVGLPVYMWTTVNQNTWGPITASASAGGLTVTITGRATKIVWDMGDGTPAVTCANPGTPYQPSYGAKPSPNCGHVYRQSSRTRPDSVYRVTATTSWEVAWNGGGASGVIDTTRQSQTTVRIDELQVVTK